MYKYRTEGYDLLMQALVKSACKDIKTHHRLYSFWYRNWQRATNRHRKAECERHMFDAEKNLNNAKAFIISPLCRAYYPDIDMDWLIHKIITEVK